MFSLAHFFLRCCHTFFTSALGLLPWTSTLREWCKSEKFWKFQILTKFKFKLNIIFSEKIGKIQKKSEKFQIFKKKMKNSEKKSENFRFLEIKSDKNIKNRKISDFQKIWKIQKKIWKFQIFRKNLKSDFQKKIWKFQRKSENFRFSEKKIWKKSEKIWKFQIFRKKTENFRKNKISEKI